MSTKGLMPGQHLCDCPCPENCSRDLTYPFPRSGPYMKAREFLRPCTPTIICTREAHMGMNTVVHPLLGILERKSNIGIWPYKVHRCSIVRQLIRLLVASHTRMSRYPQQVNIVCTKNPLKHVSTHQDQFTCDPVSHDISLTVQADRRRSVTSYLTCSSHQHNAQKLGLKYRGMGTLTPVPHSEPVPSVYQTLPLTSLSIRCGCRVWLSGIVTANP